MLTHLLITLMLFGCATPPGKLRDSDYVWQEKRIQAPYQEVYKRLVLGFRSDDYGDPDAHLFPDSKEGLFDVYLKSYKGSLNPWVVGIIKLKADTDNTTVMRAGTNEGNIYFRNTGWLRERWLKYADGE